MNFELLINTIQQTNTALQQSAVKAINRHVTIRNWLIGFYIYEYEQRGEDRAEYGERLVENLAKKLNNKSLSNGNLKVFRQFYLAYPHIGNEVSNFLSANFPIRQSLIGETANTENYLMAISQSLIGESQETEKDEIRVPADKLISRLSFTHLVQLLPISDPLKRTFYEVECMKGNWSVRELKRQINSLYYERSGLSNKPQKLSALVAEKAEAIQPQDVIKSVYTFEFLGLNAKDVIEETDLETALLDHLQEFMLEMGHGFCLEARQKKILIGDEYYFIDIVFYHRILKCHVLLELKIEEFNHINAGQLNTYLNYYKAEVMQFHDNPPVGILLVTNKNDALVQYATAGMDNAMFVSKYLVELPGKHELESFIKAELKKL